MNSTDLKLNKYYYISEKYIYFVKNNFIKINGGSKTDDSKLLDEEEKYFTNLFYGNKRKTL